MLRPPLTAWLAIGLASFVAGPSCVMPQVAGFMEWEWASPGFSPRTDFLLGACLVGSVVVVGGCVLRFGAQVVLLALPCFLAGCVLGFVHGPTRLRLDWKRQCEAGSVIACRLAAPNFIDGFNAPLEPETGWALYRRGCELGDDGCCAALDGGAR